MDSNSTVAILEKVANLEPSFNGYEPEKMDLDRIGTVATMQLKNCDGLDLLTSVWRGRIISTTKMIFDQRDARSIYYKWLKDNGLTEKAADKLISTAQKADYLLGEEKLTLTGIANIALKAFEAISNDINTLTVVAQIAEGGAEVTCDTAKRLLAEQTVAQTEVLDDEIKVKVSEGLLPISKTAKLVDEIEKINDRLTIQDDDEEKEEEKSVGSEILEILSEDISIDSLNFCLERSKALNKYLDNAPNIANFKDLIDVDVLLDESSRLDVLPLMAQICSTLSDLETLATKLHSKKAKLTNLCDRLYVESSSGDNNLRLIANKFGLELKELVVPVTNDSTKQIIVTSEMIDVPEEVAENS